jgi:tetratricopeptide (TPR) repeat protein
MRGQIAVGEAACSLAISIKPSDTDAYELRGYAYLIEHRFERAEADFLTALKARPNEPEDLAGYGQSLSGLGQFPQAVAQFSKAVALAPGNAAYLNGLCWARAGTGRDLGTALEECIAALVLAPAMAAPLNSRGLVELRMARYQAAIVDYTASLAANARQPSAMFGRGLAHLELGQTDQGRTDIQTAREGDADIDTLYVTLGVLPRDCQAKGKVKCPAGFPMPITGSKFLIARGE